MVFRGVRTGTEYGVAYHYDNAGTGSQLTGTGRFKRITGPGLPGYVDPSSPGYGVEYSHLADSDLLEYTSYKSDADTTLARTQRDYESNRDLIDYIENHRGTGLSDIFSKYDYTNDSLGRRTAVDASGTWAGPDISYGYNSRSELTSADKAGDSLSPNWDYEYDLIGNRTEYTLDTYDPQPVLTYTTDDLNRYGHVASSDEQHEPSEYLCYDDDGNLTQSGKPTANCETKDGSWKYVWDAENRLVGMHTGDLASPQANDKWLEFKYDYMGRRVEKTYKVYSGGWQVQSGYPIRFVYDGWNPVLVLKSDNTPKYKLTWGLDLSGTTHGAGGIGGLLACEEPAGASSNRYWYFYDGNGNVRQILDGSSPSFTVASYQYDPYGNLINSTGTYKDENPIRFSTKWFDTETSLGYWGHRYYSSRLGRWISRDPIGEEGGLNVYAFVENIPTQAIDPLGEVGSWEPRWPQPRGWEPIPPTPRPPDEVCGVYVLLYTGQWCNKRYIYNAALDAAVGTEKCWWDCMVYLHKCGIAAIADTAGAAATLAFTHREIAKTEWQIAKGGVWNPNVSEVTTLQSQLSLALKKLGFNRSSAVVRSGCRAVKMNPVAGGVTSVVAGVAMVEAGMGLYCGYQCSK